MAHVGRERAIGMLQANMTQLMVTKRFRCHVRTIGRLKNSSDKLGQRHTVRLQDVDVRRRYVKIETSRRLICAIDFIWSQSQQGHSKELIIQTVRNRLKRFA